VPEKLKVGQPPGDRAHPQKRHAGDDQQSYVDAVLLHGEFRSAMAPLEPLKKRKSV
jgi:hypothetical protein